MVMAMATLTHISEGATIPNQFIQIIPIEQLKYSANAALSHIKLIGATP